MIKKLLYLLLLVSSARAADLTEIPYGIPFHPQVTGTISFSNFTIDSRVDASNLDATAALYQMPEAATITTACFRYGARTGTPVQHKISIQGVSASARTPDGTILGGGSPASTTFTPPNDTSWDGTWQCKTLDNSIALTRGQFISMVIEPVGTPDVSNNSSFTSYLNGIQARNVFPIPAQKTNGTWAVANEYVPIFAIKSASRTYGYPMLSIDNTTTTCSDSTPDEIGLQFSIPSGATTSYEAVGAEVFLDSTPSASKSFKVILYDDTSVLASVTVDSDNIPNVSSQRTLKVYFSDATLPTLTPGTNYILAIQPQETGCNMELFGWSVNTAAELSAYAGGADWVWATRTNAGAWSTTTTKRLMVSPILKTMTASGGGSSIPTVYQAEQTLGVGATSQCFDLFVASSTTGLGLTGLAYNSGGLGCYYYRPGMGSTAQTITLQSSTLGTYTSGAFKEISSSNMPGHYEFCPPDNAFAAGATSVELTCKGATNMAQSAIKVTLLSGSSFGFDGALASESGTTLGLASGGVTQDDQFNGSLIALYSASGKLDAKSCIVDSANTGDTVTTAEDISGISGVGVGSNYVISPDAGCKANVAAWNGTNIPLVHTAGYPVITIKDGTGTGELDTASGTISGISGSVSISAGGITSSSFAAGAIDASAIAADAIGASEIAAGAITDSEISTAGANRIADQTLRRTTANAEASSYGDAVTRKSLYGSVAQQTHKTERVGSDLKTYKADGSTVLSTRAVSTQSGANPIIGIGD